MVILAARTRLIRSVQIETTEGRNTTAPLPIVSVIRCLLVQKIKNKERIVSDTLRQEAGGKRGVRERETGREREG